MKKLIILLLCIYPVFLSAQFQGPDPKINFEKYAAKSYDL